MNTSASSARPSLLARLTASKRVILAGLAQGLLLILTSTLVNGWIFASANESIAVGRPPTSLHFLPGLPLATFAWGVLLAFGYRWVEDALPHASPTRRGARYGLAVFALFVAPLELFNYLLYDFPFMAIVAGWLCYVIALTAGGIVLAHFASAREHERSGGLCLRPW